MDAGVHRPLQTAHGRVLDRTTLASYLGDADAILMDWRPFDGVAWGGHRPSFCYVVSLPGGRVLAEETCLVGAPPLSEGELERRLRVRLGRHGVPGDALATAPTEHVRIPMTTPAAPRSGALRFGSAGDQLNPITGYSVFASLAAVDVWAASLLAGRSPRRRRDPWRPVALRALLASSAAGTVDLFDAFGRLPAADQRTVLDPQAPASALLASMGRQWWRQPGAGRVRLIGATGRGVVTRQGSTETNAGVR